MLEGEAKRKKGRASHLVFSQIVPVQNIGELMMGDHGGV